MPRSPTAVSRPSGRWATKPSAWAWRSADQVVYLVDGRVVATGTHAGLMATEPGYLNLVTAYEQAEAAREEESRIVA